MKIVFNFIQPLAVALLLGATLCASPATAHADVYWSTRDLLADFFRTSTKVSFQKVDVRGELKARVEGRLGYALPRDSYTLFVATTGAHVDGYALVDEENGEHLPITFAVKISPTGSVERQEIMAYREPRGDEVRDERFRRQFRGKTAHDPVRVGDDVVVVSGATISSRAMAVGVKRALVLVDEAVLRSPQLIQVSSISAASPRR